MPIICKLELPRNIICISLITWFENKVLIPGETVMCYDYAPMRMHRHLLITKCKHGFKRQQKCVHKSFSIRFTGYKVLYVKIIAKKFIQCKWELYNYITKQSTTEEVPHSMPPGTPTLDIKMGSMLWKKSKLSKWTHKIRIFHSAYVEHKTGTNRVKSKKNT